VRENKASIGSFQPFQEPDSWSDAYTTTDRESIALIVSWLNQHQRSLTWISTAAHVNRSTLSTVLKGNYPSPPEKILRKVAATIHNINERDQVSGIPFIESTVTQMVWMACRRARTQRSFSVVTAEVGTGKTRSLQEYAKAHPNTYLIQSDPLMSPTILMDELVELLGIPAGRGYRSKERKFRLVVEELKGSDILLILDEAETVSDYTLHYLRRIRDKAEIGIVLAGTPKLDRKIAPIGGQFDQIRSRVMFWPKPIRAATREDIAAVASAAFEDIGELDDATLKALWHHSQGSMRMLAEGLIPAIRDYGLKKHPMSADLVHAIARDVLSLAR
jgi:DNA transposition AAA+ family ATPase